MALIPGSRGLVALTVVLVLASLQFPGASAIGVNYGAVANNLPSPAHVVSLIQSTYISKVKIYDSNPEIISAFANTGISLVVGARNDEIASLASSASFAQQWVSQNVASHYPSTNIIVIVVGNEVLTSAPNLSHYLVPAMQNLYTGLSNLGLSGKIKVSTPHSYGVLSTSYPPSDGIFRSDLAGPIITPMLNFLAQTGGPFMINVYPYFAYRDNPKISISYALFGTSTAVVDSVTGLSYSNLFDAQVDGAYAAMAKLGHQDITVTVSETGWPSFGDANEVGVSITNAQTYISNLLQHINGKGGTPHKPGTATDTYIFALFNENQKPGPSSERNFGLFLPDESVVYNVGLVTHNTNTSSPTPPPPPVVSTTPPPPVVSVTPPPPPVVSMTPPPPPVVSITPPPPPVVSITPPPPPVVSMTPPPPPVVSMTPPPPPVVSITPPPPFVSTTTPPPPPTPTSTPPASPSTPGSPPPPFTTNIPPPPFTAPPPPYPVPHIPPTAGSTPSPPVVSTAPPPPATSTPPPATSTPPATSSPPPASSSPPPPSTSTTPPPPSFFNPPPGASSPPPASGTPPFFASPPPPPSATSTPPPATIPPPSASPPPPVTPVTGSPPPPAPPAPAALSPPPPTPPAPTVPAPVTGAPLGTPPAPPGTASGPNTWCVAKPGSAMADLANALNYACGTGGADCSQIQPAGSCFNPNTLFSHASYAFDSYYAKNGRNYWNCFFGNSSLISITNPSYAGCAYP